MVRDLTWNMELDTREIIGENELPDFFGVPYQVTQKLLAAGKIPYVTRRDKKYFIVGELRKLVLTY